MDSKFIVFLCSARAPQKIVARFLATHQLEPPAAIWVRIVVDNDYNSSTCICSVGPPASGTYKMTGAVEFLTFPLNAGAHTIDVQFLRESGSPEILDRTLTVVEIATGQTHEDSSC